VSQLLVGRTAIKAQHLHPGEGAAFEVLADQFVQIITLKGTQVATFVGFSLSDRDERLSTAQTRLQNKTLMLQQGMTLYSSRGEPMFELLEDTVKRHDILYPMCDVKTYESAEGEEPHANCRTAIAGALAAHGITDGDLPDPVSWFMTLGIVGAGGLEIQESLAEKNSHVLLRAVVDTVIAVAACPQEKGLLNAGDPSDILVRVFR
jgi:uncharacterized protein YcgI (DUF1989 family)